MTTYRNAFVSHAHANNAQCDPFVAAFQRRGVSLYYDRANPQVGHDLSESLERELERATALIVMITPAALASFWVREISIFFALMARDPSRLLIPIKLEPCELPPRLAARWWVDATDLAQDHVVDQVVQALALVAGTQAPSLPPSSPQPPRDTLPPLGPAPTPANSAPAHHLTPMPLYNLGFRGYSVNGVECILPPLCPVPAGVFTMGSDKSRDPEAFDDETPQYPVEVDAFALGQHPVTVAEYGCAVRANAVREPPTGYPPDVDWVKQQTQPNHPVVYVSWNDVVAYASWLAQTTGQRWRLPSEAEWEKAARGTDGHLYPWGDTFDKTRCNTNKSGIGTTTPVGRYPTGESPYHVQDMAGNVWEWTSSLYMPYPYRKNDGRENLNSTDNRVLRGDSWFDNSQNARAAVRLGWPDGLSGFRGFRLALAATGSSAPGQ